MNMFWNLARLILIPVCSGFVFVLLGLSLVQWLGRVPFLVVIGVFFLFVKIKFLIFIVTKLTCDVDCEKLGEAVDSATRLHRSDG